MRFGESQDEMVDEGEVEGEEDQEEESDGKFLLCHKQTEPPNHLKNNCKYRL